MEERSGSFLPELPYTNRGVIRQKEELSALIDWCQITIKEVPLEAVIEDVLRIPMELMTVTGYEKGIAGHEVVAIFDNIKVLKPTGNAQYQGFQILMSGKGCRNYENFLQLNEETWFDFLNRVCQYHINVPRIDLAIDDRKPYLSIPDLIVRTKEGLLSSKLREIDFHDSGELKEEVFQSKGGSLYLGSSASNLRLVFYEKGYDELIKDKVFMEQLLVASPSLYHSVKNIDKCNEKKKQKIKISIKSYAKRAALRTTPFGIFTAINVVDLKNETNSNVKKISFTKKATPDYLWIYSLVKSYEIKNIEELAFKINTAAFIQGDRYVLPFTVSEFEEDRNISLSKPVQILIEKCQKNYVNYEELIKILKTSYPEIALEVLTSFIYNLVENDFLISDLRPPICNINPLDYLLSKLEKGRLKNDLQHLKNMIENYNDLKIGEGCNLLLQIFDVMKNIHKYDIGGNYLKVDSIANFNGRFDVLSEKSLEIIKQLAEMFVKLNNNVKRRGGRKNSLKEYQLKFIGKYGENCAIPLVEVINKDVGIGFPDYYKDESGEAIEFSDPIMQMFEKKYEEALLDGKSIEFRSKDLHDFKLNQNNSLESFELNFNIKKLNDDIKLYLGANIGSGQAGRSFGRFYTLSEQLKTTIQKLDQKNCMNVELSFVPNQIRIANVMQNYSTETFNTSFFTTSWDSTNEIRLEDIYIRYSEGKFHFTTSDGKNELKFTMNNMLNPESQRTTRSPSPFNISSFVIL